MLCGRVAGTFTDPTPFVFPSQLVAPSQDNTLSLVGDAFGCCSGSPECESVLGGSVSQKLDVKDCVTRSQERSRGVQGFRLLNLQTTQNAALHR